MQSPRTRRAGVIVVGVLAVLALVLAACSSAMTGASAPPGLVGDGDSVGEPAAPSGGDGEIPTGEEPPGNFFQEE